MLRVHLFSCLLLANLFAGLVHPQLLFAQTAGTSPNQVVPATPIWSVVENAAVPRSFRFDPTGKRLVVASGQDLTVFDTSDGDVVARMGAGSFERVFSDVILSAYDNSVHLVVVRNGENQFFETAGLNGAPVPDQFSTDIFLHDGKHLESVSADITGQIHLFAGEFEEAHVVYSKRARSLTLPSDFGTASGAVLKSGDVVLVAQDGLIFYDPTGREVSRIDGVYMGFAPGRAVLSNDETLLAVSNVYDGEADGGLRVFDLKEKRIAYDLPLPEGDSQFLADMRISGSSVIVALVDYTNKQEQILRVYKLDASHPPKILQTVPLGDVGNLIALNPDASRLAVTWFNGRSSVYSLDAPTTPQVVPAVQSDQAQPPRLVAGLGHAGQISDVALSPDGQVLATSGENGQIWIWDMQSNRAINSINLSAGRSKLLFSDDGQFFFAVSSDYLARFDVKTGERLDQVASHTNIPRVLVKEPTGTNFFWCDTYGCHTGNPVNSSPPQRLQTPLRPFSQALLCDGQRVFRSSQDGQTVFALEPINAPEQSTSFTADFQVSQAACVDDGTLALGTKDGWLLRVSTQGDILARVQLGETAISGIQPLAEARILVALNGQGYVNNDDEPAQMFVLSSQDLSVQNQAVFPAGQNGTSAYVSNLIVSHDQKTVVTTTQSGLASAGKITRWTLPDLVPSQGPAPATHAPQHVQFTPDGKSLAVTSRDATTIWAIDTGQVTSQVEHAFMAQVSVTDQGVLSIGSIGSLSALFEIAQKADVIPVRVPTPGGLASREFKLGINNNDTAELVAEDGTDLGTVPLSGVTPLGAVASPSGDALVVAGYDNQTLLWDAKTGATHLLDARIVGKLAVAFSPDGALLALAEKTGFVSLWNVQSGGLLAQLISTRDGGWAVVSPEGRYDAADPGNVADLSWVFPDALLTPEPVETYYLDYYEPRLLARKVQAEVFPPLPLPSQRNRVTPQVRFVEVLPVGVDAEGIQRVNVQLKVQQTERDGVLSGVGPIKLFRDGQLIGVDETLRLDAASAMTVHFKDIPLPPDQSNTNFSAYAFNNDGIKSETSSYLLRHTSKATAKRRAYVLAVGVNKYENPSWDLSYAASDAEANAQLIAEGLRASGAFEAVHGLALISHQDAQPRLARRDVIEAILNQIAGRPMADDTPQAIAAIAMEFPPARPQDLVYVALAGHGLATADGQFHFFPQEFGAGTSGRVVNEATLKGTLNSDRLAELLLQIDVRDMLLVIDACNSAASIEGGGFRPGPMGSRGLGQLAYDKSMRVLAASQAEALALESGQLRHGALTYAMLREGFEALNADRAPQDGNVSFRELFGFTTERVPALYSELQTGSFAPLTRGFTSLIDDTDTAVLDVQRPALFDFRNVTRADVALSPPIARD